MKNYLKDLFGAKQRQIQADLDEYLANLNAIALDLREAIRAYLAKEEEEFLSAFEQINKMENRLDTAPPRHRGANLRAPAAAGYPGRHPGVA